MIIAVIGGSECKEDICDIAYEVGKEIALSGHILVNGGRGGVMEASAHGAYDAGRITIGILPQSRSEANPYIKIPIVTGIGECRNMTIIKTADVVIAIDGSFGTLSEMAFALKMGVPLVGIKTWKLSSDFAPYPEIHRVEDPKEAVRLAIKLGERERNW